MREMLTEAEVAEFATHHGAAVEALDELERASQRLELSFPDALREVLEILAQRRGSGAALVATRPGCWEARHIEALAATYDLGGVEVDEMPRDRRVGRPLDLVEPLRPETVTGDEMNDEAFRATLGPWTGVTWRLPNRKGGTEPELFTECRAHIERDGGWDADDDVVGTVLYGAITCGWVSKDLHGDADGADGERQVDAIEQLRRVDDKAQA